MSPGWWMRRTANSSLRDDLDRDNDGIACK
ncbi:excalibur calcium-binding domain-containing protein [Corynebacterium lemuris]